MVTQVQDVSHAPRSNSERGREEGRQEVASEARTFDDVFRNKLEAKVNGNLETETITYGRDRMLNVFYHQQRALSL